MFILVALSYDEYRKIKRNILFNHLTI